MSRRLENLMNVAKIEIKTETISVTRRKIGGGGGVEIPPTPHPSKDWDVETDDPPFYIHIRMTITVEQCGVRCPTCGVKPSRCPCS